MSKTKAGPISADRLKSLAPYAERMRDLHRRHVEIVRELGRAETDLVRELGLPKMHTYVIGMDGVDLVKIGKAANVRKRLAALQTGCPAKLRVFRTIPFDCERRMHQRFARQRRQGEWFVFDLAMLTEVYNQEILGYARDVLNEAVA